MNIILATIKHYNGELRIDLSEEKEEILKNIKFSSGPKAPEIWDLQETFNNNDDVKKILSLYKTKIYDYEHPKLGEKLISCLRNYSRLYNIENITHISYRETRVNENNMIIIKSS